MSGNSNRYLALTVFSGESSRTKKVFELYKQKHKIECEEINLLKEEVPLHSQDSLVSRFTHHTNEVDKLIHAEKLLFAFPIWNFGLPSPLKAWLDRAILPGKSFVIGSKGPVSSLKANEAIILCTAGAYYSSEMACPYQSLKDILKFLGVTKITEVFIQGMDMGNNLDTLIKDRADLLGDQP